MRIKATLLLLFSIFIISCSIEPNVTSNTSEQGKIVDEFDNGNDLSEPAESIDYVYKTSLRKLKHGNEREKYIWDLLRLSLEATVDDYGPYEMIGVEGINQIREDVELINNTGRITIISDSLNEDNLNNLNRIEVPLLRNLLGYRVFFY